jgi:hypothetical protein
MPAAIPLHVLRSRLIMAEAAVRAADQVLATSRLRAGAIKPTEEGSDAHLADLERAIREVKQVQQKAVRDAAEARTQAAQCALLRAEVMALVTDIER